MPRWFARGFPPTTGSAWELPSTPGGRLEAASWAYRIILLREPESAASLEHLATHAGSARGLRDTLLRSEEARAQPGFPLVLSMTGNEPAQEVQVHVGPAERAVLFERVQATWRELGRDKPHWSVVTADAFRPENIDASMDAFYASGEANIATLMKTLERNGIDATRIDLCIDFGCGVGRLTLALSRRAREVIGVDVSDNHLRHAREAFAARGATNASTRLVESIDAVDSLPLADLVVSLIVLQHNPPPVMRALLDKLLGRLAPGGAAIIQVPTYLPVGYAFRLDSYLRGAAGDMEMHALPQREVFAAAREAGVDVLEVLDDHWTGYGAGSRSNTFVMRRPA